MYFNRGAGVGRHETLLQVRPGPVDPSLPGRMSAAQAPAEVVPCAGAIEDDRHWSGVAPGQSFELVFFFDASRYTEGRSDGSNGTLQWW